MTSYVLCCFTSCCRFHNTTSTYFEQDIIAISHTTQLSLQYISAKGAMRQHYNTFCIRQNYGINPEEIPCLLAFLKP